MCLSFVLFCFQVYPIWQMCVDRSFDLEYSSRAAMGSTSTKLQIAGYHWSAAREHIQQFAKYCIFFIVNAVLFNNINKNAFQ